MTQDVSALVTIAFPLEFVILTKWFEGSFDTLRSRTNAKSNFFLAQNEYNQ